MIRNHNSIDVAMNKRTLKNILIIVFLIACVVVRNLITSNREDKKKKAIQIEEAKEKKRKDSLEILHMLSFESFKKDNEAFRKGKKRCKGFFENDSREGKWECYYPTGSLESEGIYKDNLKEGAWNYYYNTGYSRKRLDLMMIVHYNKGLKNGKQTFFNELNKLDEISYYKNDKMDSVYTEYHYNGNVKTLGNLKQGKRIGEWRFFSEDNEVVNTKLYN